MVGVYAVTKMFRVVPAPTIEAHIEKYKGDCSSGSSPTTRRSGVGLIHGLRYRSHDFSGGGRTQFRAMSGAS